MKLTTINCNLFDGENYIPTPCDAYLLEQNLLPDFKFYITKNPFTGGFSLTEFVTGFTISGAYTESSKPKAAAWLQTRIDRYGIKKLREIILDQQSKHDALNA